MKKLDSVMALYVHELKDMHSAEKQLLSALPKMAKAASNPELAKGFQQHREQTEGHLERVDQILDSLGVSPGRDKCEGMQGLIEEGDEIIKAKADDDVRDAGLIIAAQKVEHYEIASYGSLVTFARLLGRSQDARLLEQVLEEEKETDEKLTALAESSVNVEAANQ